MTPSAEIDAHDFRDRFCRKREGGGVEWQPGYRCLICWPMRPFSPGEGQP